MTAHADMTATPLSGDALARRNALLLAAATALAGANASVIFATGAITGALLAPEAGLATLPITIFVIGMAFATIPNGMIARRWGRRVSFLVGATAGVLMGVIGAVAVVQGSFALYNFATFCGGIYAAVAQSYRFAAADSATPAFRPKAISWTMAGGVFAGVLGPQIVSLTMNLWQPYLFAASYLAQASVAFVAMGVLIFVKAPSPVAAAAAAAESAPARPLVAIITQPRFVTAAVCGVASYGLMNLVMTSAPLAMKLCGHDLTASNLAIQWHVMAMYGPSFFTGALIARFGASRVIAAGLLLTAAAAVVDLAGTSVAHFWTGLILLGVGWNFGYVGASAMVTETHRASERNKVQSFNDFLVFGTMAMGSFSSGKLLTNFGWDAVNQVVFPPVVVGMAALLWLSWRRAQGRLA